MPFPNHGLLNSTAAHWHKDSGLMYLCHTDRETGRIPTTLYRIHTYLTIDISLTIQSFLGVCVQVLEGRSMPASTTPPQPMLTVGDLSTCKTRAG